MSFNVNPVAWKGIVLSVAGKVVDKTLQDWQRQVADFCTQVQNILGAGTATQVRDLGTISTDQVINVAGAYFVSIRLTSTASQTRIVTLNNLPAGASVSFDVNSTASSLTLKLAATNPSGIVYAITAWNTSTAAMVDMVATGEVLGVLRYLFTGMTGIVGSTPNLNLLFI